MLRKIAAILLLCSLVLAACDEEFLLEADEATSDRSEAMEETEGITDYVESTLEEGALTEPEAAGENREHNYIVDLEEPIYDSDEVAFTLTKVERKDEQAMSRGYYLTFEVENKLDEAIALSVNPRKMSADSNLLHTVQSAVGYTKLAEESTGNLELALQSYAAELPEISDLLELEVELENSEGDLASEHHLSIDFASLPLPLATKMDDLQEIEHPDPLVRAYDDELIYEADNLAIILKQIEKNETAGYVTEKLYEVTLELQNKSDQDIVFSTVGATADGIGIDAVLAGYIAAEEVTEEVMTLSNSGTGELSDIRDYLEVDLRLLEEDTVERMEFHTIRIEF